MITFSFMSNSNPKENKEKIKFGRKEGNLINQSAVFKFWFVEMCVSRKHALLENHTLYSTSRILEKR